MSLFSHAPKRLSDISAPERVTVTATVASPSAFTSPLTGLAAAAFYVSLFQRVTEARQQPGSATVVDALEPVGAVVFGERLLLAAEPDGQLVDVPLEGARFVYSGAGPAVVPLERVPPELMRFVEQAAGRGLVCFREQTFGHGDRVKLTATLAPQGGREAGGYRSAAAAAFLARHDLGEVWLEEILDVPHW
jgi:hypothetical protein